MGDILLPNQIPNGVPLGARRVDEEQELRMLAIAIYQAANNFWVPPEVHAPRVLAFTKVIKDLCKEHL